MESAKNPQMNKMAAAPVNRLMLSMGIPMIISMMLQAVYNIVDSAFVSNMAEGGEQALNALTLAFPVQMLMVAIAIGTGVGMNALMSRSLGQGDRELAGKAAGNAIFLAAVIYVVFLLFGIFGTGAYIGSQTKNAEIAEMAEEYIRICCTLSFGIIFFSVFEKTLQASGRSLFSTIAQVAGAVTNIVLDPVLIFGLGPVPALGIAGAALATGIGQAVSLVVYLYVYCTTEVAVRFSRRCLRFDAALDGKLYAIGVPAILNLALPSLLVTFLNGLLAVYSQSYVTVLGIYYKLQTFLYLPANGIVQGMRPLVGYNYGAREHGRVSRLYNLTLGLSAGIMAIGTLLCLTIAGPLMGLFTSNPETIAIGQTALRVICLGFIVSAVSTTSSGALEGLGKGVPSLVISLCRYIIFIMPIAWVLCGRMGPTGVWHAFWITEVISAAVSLVVYRRAVRR